MEKGRYCLTTIICVFMEKIGEGYLSGCHLDLDDQERKVLVKALLSYLQFCYYFKHLERLYRDVSLSKSLLSKLGLTDVESVDLEFKS